jgi:hypothetical protein
MTMPTAVDFWGIAVPVSMMAARMPEAHWCRYPVLALQFTAIPDTTPDI